MRTGQLEVRLRVVELRRLPGRGGMAREAVRREPGRMFRIGHVLVVGLVTREAGRGRPGVDTVLVALIARHCLMGAGQLKVGLIVVKRCGPPSCCAVAGDAVGGEPRVTRIRGSDELLLVTRIAYGRCPFVYRVRMALLTRGRHVRPRQAEHRFGIVVKGSRPPSAHRMTCQAVWGEARMGWRCGGRELLPMATDALRRRPL